MSDSLQGKNMEYKLPISIIKEDFYCQPYNNKKVYTANNYMPVTQLEAKFPENSNY